MTKQLLSKILSIFAFALLAVTPVLAETSKNAEQQQNQEDITIELEDDEVMSDED